MRRHARHVASLIAGLLLVAIPASAQVVSSLQFGAGGFFPRGLTTRAAGDVLARDINGRSIGGGVGTDSLAFAIQDFRSGHAFAEFNVGFGPHVEMGVGIGRYGRHVPSVYLDLTDHGRDIAQVL